jgi:hypothetical protein
MTATGMTRWSLCEIRLMKNRTLYLLFSSAADDIAIQFTSTLAPLSCSRGEMRPEPTSNKDILRWIVARELRYHSSRGQLMSLSLNPADIWKIFSDGKRRNQGRACELARRRFQGTPRRHYASAEFMGGLRALQDCLRRAHRSSPEKVSVPIGVVKKLPFVLALRHRYTTELGLCGARSAP